MSRSPSEHLPDVDQLPEGWVTLDEAYIFLRARFLKDGSQFALTHWGCKYIDARIDMRTGRVMLLPGNRTTETTGASRPEGCLCREYVGNALKVEDYCPVHRRTTGDSQ